MISVFCILRLWSVAAAGALIIGCVPTAAPTWQSSHEPNSTRLAQTRADTTPNANIPRGDHCPIC
jgi:hypothetical protein